MEEPPKRVKIINFEGIEMKFAQSVLKKQFPILIGFASTLYQEKKSSTEQAANITLQIKVALDCCIGPELSSWGGQSV